MRTSRPLIVYRAGKRLGPSAVYQRYYLQGLESVASIRWVDAPLRTRFARSASGKVDRAVGGRVRNAVRRRIERSAVTDLGYVGLYELHDVDGAMRRFTIDSRDNHDLQHPEALEWSDVYFKANRWKDVHYPDRVAPVVNGDGYLTADRLDQLVALRGVPKTTDVAFIANLWGGRGHVVRLFEELSRLPGRIDLAAVLPLGATPEDDNAMRERLERAGVAVHDQPLPADELWHRLATARVIVMRSGSHLCIPWRMVGLLAMGATVLYDAVPLPEWPVPLVEGEHYASMGILRPPYDPPEPEEYLKVVPATAELIADEHRRESLAAAACTYYDAYASPSAVGRYIVDRVRQAQR